MQAQVCLAVTNKLMLISVQTVVGQEMVHLHHAVEIPCLLQTEGPHEDPLSQGEGPLPLTGKVNEVLSR